MFEIYIKKSKRIGSPDTEHRWHEAPSAARCSAACMHAQPPAGQIQHSDRK
jgi:hypothetical protein